MRLIDADTAQPGLTIVAAAQTQGKGQRGKTWQDAAGQSLLMSMIVTPGYGLQEQFAFVAATATAIARTLEDIHENWHVCIKWPNDIIINDKKAGGILIENVLRGSRWPYSIIGLGLNVGQQAFPTDLPHATSLYLSSDKKMDIKTLMIQLRRAILEAVYSTDTPGEALERYNAYVYRRGQMQQFDNRDGAWKARVHQCLPDGRLEVILPDGTLAQYTHGQVNWIWT